MTPRNYVDSATQFGGTVANLYQNDGLLVAGSYATVSWNVGAVWSGAANINLATGEPVGDWYQRGALISGGVASTAGIAAGGLGIYNWATVPAAVTAETPTAVFRQGTFADPATGWEGNYVKGQQWATDNPLTTPNYAQKYGLPAQNTAKPDWVVGGQVQSPYTTRPAPPSHNNPFNTGGATEVLPQNPNNVRLDWFHMPD